ncbi:GNAT family N-acetyltransferase [Candidatus Micrarchaeota archaeon]|jgi:ribosomal protein S18 acetylase RimI-like enzyme|nr:GNAT family N-acetyltransferase [Candidatus Micrarchaeota archaeon]
MMIRPAKREDILEMGKMYEIVAEVHKEYHPIFHEVENCGVNAVTTNYIDNRNGIAFVAEENSEIVGFAGAQIKLMPETFKIKYTLHLTDVVVLPEYRGKGIGLKLIEKIKEWAGENKIQYITLSVSFKNNFAVQLYEKAGFKDLSKDMIMDVD